MPQMGVSVAEGTVVSWHKRPGDWVEADETVCEISSDKIDTEIPAPASGRLVEILVEENETVAVGTPLAEIDTGATPGEAHATERERRSADRSHVDLARGAPRRGRARGRPVAGEGNRRRRAHPQEGRLLAFIATSPDTASGRSTPSRPTGPSAQPRERPSGATPLSPMRRQIAEHMLRSRRTAAHVTTVAEVDMSRVVARRAALQGAVRGTGRAAHLSRPSSRARRSPRFRSTRC